jgi:hypothetical protein
LENLTWLNGISPKIVLDLAEISRAHIRRQEIKLALIKTSARLLIKQSTQAGIRKFYPAWMAALS